MVLTAQKLQYSRCLYLAGHLRSRLTGYFTFCRRFVHVSGALFRPTYKEVTQFYSISR